jgi:hypothetical protein
MISIFLQLELVFCMNYSPLIHKITKHVLNM